MAHGFPTMSSFSNPNCRIHSRARSSKKISRPRRWQIAAFLGAFGLAAIAFAGTEATRATNSSSRSLRTFTLRQAIEFAFQHNPAILTARQEIRRTKGMQIEVLAQALPHLDATAAFNYTDPSLRGGSGSFTTTTTGGGTGVTPSPLPTITPAPSPGPSASPGTRPSRRSK